MKAVILRTLVVLGLGAFALLAADRASAQALGQRFDCGMVKSRTGACIFQNTLMPGKAISDPVKPIKTGKACAFNVLQLVGIGDVRASTAAESAGITRFASVESEVFEILPAFGVYKIFGRYCTVVKGE